MEEKILEAIEKSLRDALENELRGRRRAINYSDVGTFSDMLVLSYFDDFISTPHIHIIDLETKGRMVDCCVSLEDGRYINHGKHKLTMDDILVDEFIEFMHRVPYSSGETYFELAIEEWEFTNDLIKVERKYDDKGKIVIPDYSKLKEE